MDLALVGNCNIAALIDREASIVWYCLPRFDGDPVFHKLLGAPHDSVVEKTLGRGAFMMRYEAPDDFGPQTLLSTFVPSGESRRWPDQGGRKMPRTI